ncbi:MAG: hypothetical protein ACR2IF_13440 [Terriglobales bacterium]
MGKEVSLESVAHKANSFCDNYAFGQEVLPEAYPGKESAARAVAHKANSFGDNYEQVNVHVSATKTKAFSATL